MLKSKNLLLYRVLKKIKITLQKQNLTHDIDIIIKPTSINRKLIAITMKVWYMRFTNSSHQKPKFNKHIHYISVVLFKALHYQFQCESYKMLFLCLGSL